jgi:hypothetical protein
MLFISDTGRTPDEALGMLSILSTEIYSTHITVIILFIKLWQVSFCARRNIGEMPGSWNTESRPGKIVCLVVFYSQGLLPFFVGSLNIL